jgi:protein-S-isoprenylcysteine O-methyltransferase Ste14
MDFVLLARYILPWIIFGILHTLMASTTVKSKFNLTIIKFRILYNVIAGLLFLIVLLFTPGIAQIIVDAILTGTSLLLFSIILGIGSFITFFGLVQWDLSGFIGLRTEKDVLITNGSYSFSRHPVYTGIIVILLSILLLEFSEVTLSYLLGIGGYFLVGSFYEEQKLEKILDGYKEYQINVGRFFPVRIRHAQYLKHNFFLKYNR